MTLRCLFCGRREDECKGGIWRGPNRSSAEGICPYCARSAVRAFGDLPDPSPAVVAIDRRPILVVAKAD